MAATDVGPFPIKNKAYRAHFLLLDADGDPATGAGTLDCEVSKDGGAFSNATNTETEIGNGWYYCELTATEMNADTVIAVLKSGTAGVKTAHIMIHPVDLKEPTAVPAFGAAGAGIEEAAAWFMALSRNKMTQTSTTTTLRNDADNASIATSTVSDDGTTVTRGEWA